MAEVETKELGPQHVDDFLAFFDKDAFSDNPQWFGCYCNYYHTPVDEDWEKRPPEVNREEKLRAIRAGSASGLLAYVDDKPVGWINAGTRENYASPRSFSEAMQGNSTGYVMCFVISPEHRGEGIATKLLDAAIAMFERDGLDCVEGYPSNRDPQSHPISSSAGNYHGSRGMYERAGFEAIRDYRGFTVMRKRLKDA